MFCYYNTHKHLIKYHLLQIKNVNDFYSKSYENIMLTGDFNNEISDGHMDFFCTTYHLVWLVWLAPSLIRTNSVFDWFTNNGLVTNSGKSYFLVSPYEKDSLKYRVDLSLSLVKNF